MFALAASIQAIALTPPPDALQFTRRADRNFGRGR